MDACGWSNCCHDGVTTSVSRAFGATTPGIMLRLGDLASHRRGRPPPLVGAWALTATGTPARDQVELEKHNKKAGASAGLRTKVSAIQGRERLSISMSTAHYRQSRFEQAGDPIPFFRVWARMLCAAGLRIDEACRSRRCDIDIVAKRVHVGQATGGRAVQLTPDTFATSGATWS